MRWEIISPGLVPVSGLTEFPTVAAGGAATILCVVELMCGRLQGSPQSRRWWRGEQWWCGVDTAATSCPACVLCELLCRASRAGPGSGPPPAFLQDAPAFHCYGQGLYLTEGRSSSEELCEVSVQNCSSPGCGGPATDVNTIWSTIRPFNNVAQ